MRTRCGDKMIKGIYQEGISDYIRTVDDFFYLVVSEGVYRIREYEFAECERLYMVKLPLSLVRLERGAFKNCVALRYVICNNYCCKVEEEVFDGCEGLIRTGNLF